MESFEDKVLITEKKNKRPKETKIAHLFTGSLAGTISRTITSPLERLRILLQTNTKEYQHIKGVNKGLKLMYAREGYYGFFRGNGINCAVQAPFTALEFYFYEVFKNTLYPNLARDELSYS